MEITTTRPERALLVGICREADQRRLEEESLQELAELTRSAGAQVRKTFLQEKQHPHPAHLVGSGKLREIRDCVASEQADVVIFDADLSPAQLGNLQQFLETKVVDRSELILDIFAQRARSREGKLQVELAQLEYLLPRLTGKGLALSRLAGGIGTRGPGETKLEMDRRTLRVRIARIKKELEKLQRRRSLHRSKRQRIPVPTVSLVGYTNAGKSTLFNQVSQEETWVSQRMFATLDPLVRKISLGSGQEVLLSDTVGFIRKLPHTLVAAFHATLEEIVEADVILHVIDVSQENYENLRRAVYEVLEEIGFDDTPILEAYNKIDRLEHIPRIEGTRESVMISARTGQGLTDLLQKIQSIVSHSYEIVRLNIPFDRADVLSRLRKRARIEAREYRDDGIHVYASVPVADLGRFQEFIDHSIYVSSRDHRQTKRR